MAAAAAAARNRQQPHPAWSRQVETKQQLWLLEVCLRRQRNQIRARRFLGERNSMTPSANFYKRRPIIIGRQIDRSGWIVRQLEPRATKSSLSGRADKLPGCCVCIPIAGFCSFSSTSSATDSSRRRLIEKRYEWRLSLGRKRENSARATSPIRRRRPEKRAPLMDAHDQRRLATLIGQRRLAE